MSIPPVPPPREPEASIVLTCFPGGQIHVEAIDNQGAPLSPLALLEYLTGMSQALIRQIKGANQPPPKRGSGLVVVGGLPPGGSKRH